MSAVGATSLLIPGPKMIWHFAELGMQQSIYTCTNGTVNTESDATPGDCKLATKPQPQWVENWLGVPQRAQIYNDWAKFIQLKINEPVFEGSYAISPDSDNLKQRIYIFDSSLPDGTLKNVVVIANFSTNTQNINPSFPNAGTWYNLMDNTSMSVTNQTAPISLAPGQFRVYGNALPTLNTDQFDIMENVHLYPNPANGYFTINTTAKTVEVFTITGQRVKTFVGQMDGSEYNVSDLTNGVYLVKVSDENGNAKTMKLIKE